MFEYFLYYIIVLIIFISYEPIKETNSPFYQAFIPCIIFLFAFYFFSKIIFKKFEKKLSINSLFESQYFDRQFSKTVKLLSVLSIIIFSSNIYVLNLPSYLYKLKIFQLFPTLSATIFLTLFTCYLIIIWAAAYKSYDKLYGQVFTKKSYILSNISFCIPILIPWLLLSGVSDIIYMLPCKNLKIFLSTPIGTICFLLILLSSIIIFGPILIQKFWNCKPLEKGYHRDRIENLCLKAKVNYANILKWPIFEGRMITAGVMGVIGKFRYILVTDALLQSLQPEEIDSVIAHEIGHVKKKHLLLYVIFVIGFIIFSFTFLDVLIFIFKYFFYAYYLDLIAVLELNTTLKSNIKSTLDSLILCIFLVAIFIIYFRYIFGYFIRNFERQADAYVYYLFKDANPLISTFKKIALSSGHTYDKPNWHHFSIKQRIDFLLKCEDDRKWVNYHNKKLKKNILTYLIAIFLIGTVGYAITFSNFSTKLNILFYEKYSSTSMDFCQLGDLKYKNQGYEKAIMAYNKAISLNPKNAIALNNLAWLYATSKNKKYQNNKKALKYSTLAVKLSQDPTFFDTLAESFYINQMCNKAIEAETIAIKLANENNKYYVKQLNKFKLCKFKKN